MISVKAVDLAQLKDKLDQVTDLREQQLQLRS